MRFFCVTGMRNSGTTFLASLLDMGKPPRHGVDLSPGEIERLRALGHVTE